MSGEWLWAGGIAGGIGVFLATIELLSRWTGTGDIVSPLEDDEEDADGSDSANADADE